MLKNNYLKFLVAVLITAVIAGVGFVPYASATTPNPIDPTNCALNDFAPDEDFGQGANGTLPHLYITWDAINLYLGIDQQTSLDSFQFQFYLDTIPGGTYKPFAGTFDIAAPATGIGYEYVYSLDVIGSVADFYTSATPTTWSVASSITSPNCAIPGGLLKVAVPWTDIGGVPPRLTVLVQGVAGGPSNVSEFWPVQPAPPYLVGLVFEAPDRIPGNPGVSPAGAPTAISLSQFTANNPQTSLLFVAGLLVVGTGAFLLLRRRTRKQEI